jgi:3-oxoacyl-[acyl-carrier protein] reductase
MPITQSLEGRAALVTGGVRNIGRAIALALADAGAAVAVCSRTQSADGESLVSEIRSRGGRALYCVADVSLEADATRFAAETHRAFGRIDILVNNAAIRRLSPIEQMTLAEWREVMGATLDSAFLCARACVPHMTRGCGRIVSIGGTSAHRGAGQRAHVVASKAGIVGLTKALAVELAGRGITVNCVVPGVIDTARDANAGAIPPHPQGFDAPLGRRGKPEEVAAMVAYLASDAAAYVTGQTIHVNGGLYLP